MLSIITIRNVPDEVKLAIKNRARSNHRSMEKEALVILMQAAGMETPQERARRIRQDEAIARMKAAKRWKATQGWRFDRAAHYDEELAERGLL